MYFLLSQLSLMGLMYLSTTVPKMVFNFLSGEKGISYLGCGVQSFFFLTMACSEGLLLASMAYDRSYLPPPALLYPHEQKDVYEDDYGILDLGVYQLPGTHSLCPPHSLLPVQGYWSLLLWCPSYVASGLYGHLGLWVHGFCEHKALSPPSFPRHHCFLWPSSFCCLPYAFKRWKEKGLHHLFNTFNCSDILLCTFCLHLSSAQESPLTSRR